jgi:hypothetical protein
MNNTEEKNRFRPTQFDRDDNKVTNRIRFFPLYDKKVAEDITLQGMNYIKAYFIPYRDSNGIPIDKRLKVLHDSNTYHELIKNGFDFNKGYLIEDNTENNETNT